MSAIVVDHLHLTVPVDELATIVAREFELIFRAQPGFERFYLVKVSEAEAIVVTVWADEAAAEKGASVMGPTLFARHLGPVLASPQERSVGTALVTIE